MLKNILLWIVIMFVWYILLIFTSPKIAWNIANILGLNWFNEFVLKLKSGYDQTVTNLPTKEEVLDTYEKVYSWAIEVKTNVKNWINTTKNTIDDIRETLSWAEDTFNDIKDWVNKAKDFIETASWTLNNTVETIDNFSETYEELTSTWETN